MSEVDVGVEGLKTSEILGYYTIIYYILYYNIILYLCESAVHFGLTLPPTREK